MEKIPSRKQDQGDLFSGESLAKYCDPKSPEFLDRFTDVVVSRMDYAKKHNELYRSSYFVVKQLLTELRLQEKFNITDVVNDVLDKLRQREIDAGQVEIRELNEKKIAAEIDKRIQDMPEEGDSNFHRKWWHL